MWRNNQGVIMKRRLNSVLVAMVLSGAAGHAHAAAQYYNETYQIMGCRSYMEGREQNRGWLVGYLTALEIQRGTNYLRGRNLQQVYNLFDGYCRANPRQTMDDAANAVFARLRR